MPDKTNTIFQIGFLLVNEFTLMSYSSATEPLRAANLLAGKTLYKIFNIPLIGTQAESSGGAIIPQTVEPTDLPNLDLLLLMAGGEPEVFAKKSVYLALKPFIRNARMLGGISGGPAILAGAGLMQGRRMTVHWEYRKLLEKLEPNALVEKSLYVFDRDRMTCAGGIASIDMMHALITEHHGQAFARKVSDWFIHTDIRPRAGPQRAGLVTRYGTNNPHVIATIEAMENHIADTLDLPRFAQLCGISERQLNRLFNKTLGTTTIQFYRELRLNKARQLLIQSSSLSITDIALLTGFTSSSHFTSSFVAVFGITPSSLRK